MLLSCSLLIRINGSHDTALLLSLMQPLLESHLTFCLFTPRKKIKKEPVWRSKGFLDRPGQHFVVLLTSRQCLTTRPGCLMPTDLPDQAFSYVLIEINGS